MVIVIGRASSFSFAHDVLADQTKWQPFVEIENKGLMHIIV